MNILLRKNRISALLILTVMSAMLLVSCSGSADEDSLAGNVPGMVVRFTLQSTMSGTSSGSNAADGYEDGSADENYIDVNNSCRVLFFSVNNTFLGTLNRPTVAAISGTGYKQYSLYGIPPENLPSDFKIMVAANWPDMSAVDNAEAGSTTIDDICRNLASCFDYEVGSPLSVEEGRLMPFFGIHSYTGINIVPGTTTLPEEITMLRALAKVEVLFYTDSDDVPADVRLCGFNLRGFCAPAAVYSQNDYGQGNDWENDYLHRLHLVSADNNNEPGAGARIASLIPRESESLYRYSTYVPEYRNLLDNGTPVPDEAFIELRLSSQSALDEPFRLYFAEYSGSSSANTSLPRYNIERNNIYRFNISLHRGKLVITARPWNYRPQPEINA